MNFSDSHSGAIGGHFAKIAHKVAKSKILQKFELNRNLQRIPFKMMYNMSMLRHRLSNEWWWWWGVGGGGVGVNYLFLLFRKSVYRIKRHLKMIYTKGKTYQFVNLAWLGISSRTMMSFQLATRN